MTNATTGKGWDMSGSNAELIAEARVAAIAGREYADSYSGLSPVNSIPWKSSRVIDDLATRLEHAGAAVEAIQVTSTKHLMFARRMEAERDAALAVIANARRWLAEVGRAEVLGYQEMEMLETILDEAAK